MRITLILLLLLIHGCSSVYKTDYFSATSDLEYEDRSPCDFKSGVGEINYGEPAKAAKITNNGSNIIICTRTRENYDAITIGPLIFPIIPIFSTPEAAQPTFIVTVWFKSNEEVLEINPLDTFLLTDNNEKIYIYNHTNGVASKCNEQIGYTDINKNIILSNNNSVQLCFERRDVNKSQYTMELGGILINNEKIPPKTIIFKRYRSTFFAIAG